FERMPSASNGALALGLVGGVQALPVILLALPAGHLADRFDRRKIVMLSMIVSGLFSLGLAVVAHADGPVWMIYLLLGLGATAQAVGWPARSALLPEVVPAEVFANAATWNSTSFQVASVAGPALGGLVVAMTRTGAFVIDAACSFAFVAFLIALYVR